MKDGLFYVLFLDDEVNILSSLRRLFIDFPDMEILTASSVREAAGFLRDKPIDLVVSDEKMPEINGSEFLKHVKDKFPDVLRIILTGYADFTSIMNAVNSGEVYRYLQKPWDANELVVTIRKALEYRLLQLKNKQLTRELAGKIGELKAANEDLEARVRERTIEIMKAYEEMKVLKDTVEKDFSAVIRVLTTVANNFSDSLRRHSKNVAAVTSEICRMLALSEKTAERIVAAAYLHDIGSIEQENPLQEKINFIRHPEIGENLINGVYNLTDISLMIRHHHENFDGTGFPDHLSGNKIQLGARIIRIAEDLFNSLDREGRTTEQAITAIGENREGAYDPEILPSAVKALEKHFLGKGCRMEPVKIRNLGIGMKLAHDLYLKSGVLFLPAETLITDKLLQKIASFVSLIDPDSEIRILTETGSGT